MGWFSDVFGGIEDALKNGFASLDDARRGDFSGFDDRARAAHSNLDDLVGDIIPGGWTTLMKATGIGAIPAYAYDANKARKEGDYLGMATNLAGSVGGFGNIASAAGYGDLASGTAGQLASGNYLEAAGMGGGNPYLTNFANSAIDGGVRAGVQGNSITDGVVNGAKNGAINSGINYGVDQYTPPPDVGTIGGTVEDDQGERSYWGEAPNQNQMASNQDFISSDAGLGDRVSSAYAASAPPANGSSPNVDSFMNAWTGASAPAGNVNYAGLASNLMGMYSANKQRRELRNQQNQLSQLFSPNSPYAQQARQRMERTDAAGGRRSQYGSREAQLAAALTNSQLQTMPMQNKLSQQIGGQTNAGLNNLFQLGRNAYQQAPQLGRDARQLYDMFTGGF